MNKRVNQTCGQTSNQPMQGGNWFLCVFVDVDWNNTLKMG